MINQIKKLLKKNGIESELSLNTQLRYSWYVSKLFELGFNPNKVQHLNLLCGGFIAQLDDDIFCSGANIYINDGLSNIAYEKGVQEFYLGDFCTIYDNDEEDYLLIFTKENLEDYINHIMMLSQIL